jgi:hypothetical protein
MNKEKYENLANQFESMIDSRVEYECSNDDAGSSYSHMPREGGFLYHNGEERFREWLKVNGLVANENSEWDGLIDDLLDWCEIEAGHTLDGGTTDEKFVIDSYPVGEVEDQYCLPDLASALEITEEEALEFVKLAKEDRRFCLRDNGDGGVLSYTSTDAVWQMTVDKEWVSDRVETYGLCRINGAEIAI